MRVYKFRRQRHRIRSIDDNRVSINRTVAYQIPIRERPLIRSRRSERSKVRDEEAEANAQLIPIQIGTFLKTCTLVGITELAIKAVKRPDDS